MTYQTERLAIETYIAANWSGGPIGFDAQEFTPVAGSIMLTINSGAALQGSVGRALNRINHIGTLTISMFTDGGNGSQAWRGMAETLTGLLFNKRLTSAGVLATLPATTFIRFSPPEIAPNEHPFISASFPVAPLHQTNLIAPFVRYEYRS